MSLTLVLQLRFTRSEFKRALKESLKPKRANVSSHELHQLERRAFGVARAKILCAALGKEIITARDQRFFAHGNSQRA